MSQPGPEAESVASTSSSSAGTSTSNNQSLDIGPAPTKKTNVASKWQEDWKRYAIMLSNAKSITRKSLKKTSSDRS